MVTVEADRRVESDLVAKGTCLLMLSSEFTHSERPRISTFRASACLTSRSS